MDAPHALPECSPQVLGLELAAMETCITTAPMVVMAKRQVPVAVLAVEVVLVALLATALLTPKQSSVTYVLLVTSPMEPHQHVPNAQQVTWRDVA